MTTYGKLTNTQLCEQLRLQLAHSSEGQALLRELVTRLAPELVRCPHNVVTSRTRCLACNPVDGTNPDPAE